MSKLSASLFAALCLSSPIILSACAFAATAEPVKASAQVEAFELELQAGEILQLILVKTREGDAARAVRSDYFKTVVPVAGALGGKNHGFMPIVETLVGTPQPEGISVFTFPNQDAQNQFRSHPQWETFKRMRREAWDQLDIFSFEVPEDMTLRFDPAKSYTIAAAWTRPGTMTDYQRYLDGIEADFDQIGAQYVAQLNGVALQSQTETVGDPSQLTIVEWSDGPNLRGLQKTDSYQSHAGDFQKAVSRFDLYAFNTPKG